MCVFDAEVALAVDAEYGRVPLVGIEMGRMGKGILHFAISLTVPGRRLEVPVGKPHLFGFEILLLGVENAVVGDETLEALVVVAGEPINTIAAKAGTDGAKSLTVYVGFGCNVVDGREIVAHTLAAVVA